jgi:DNA-binding CsgD family transcriptional regulator
MYSSVLFKSWRKFFLYGIIAIMVAILIFMKDVKLSFIKSSFPVYSPYYMGLRYLGYPLIIYFFYSLIIFYRSRNRQSKFEKLYENPEADQNSVNITDVFDAISRRDNSFVPTFIRLYPDFAHKIRAINSGITTNEMEVCALLKLGLSTKEIAIATNTSYKSVESARFRIRKKLNLNAETNLITFFSSI